MRRTKAAVVAALLTLLVLLPVAAAPVAARSEQARVLAYWTKDRIAHAIPRDFVRQPSGQLSPKKGKPGPSTVVGASWTKGGQILKASGKVVFTMGGVNYICSGSVVNDPRTGNSMVLTAGHCAYDQAARAFATNWMFIPEFDSAPNYSCPLTRHGCWVASGLVVDNGFASAGGFNSQATVHDFAIAIVGAGDRATQLDDTVGSFGITYGGISVGDHLYAFGYPAAGKYHGFDLVYCAGDINTDPLNANKTWRMACDMTGGSSGGPWLSGFNERTGIGVLSSLNSYGYSGVRNMYGPKFNSDTQSVVGAASSRTSNYVVP
jgi:hypothetical protein